MRLGAWTSLPFGYKTLRVQFLDGAGNYSERFSDYILPNVHQADTRTVCFEVGLSEPPWG